MKVDDEKNYIFTMAEIKAQDKSDVGGLPPVTVFWGGGAAAKAKQFADEKAKLFNVPIRRLTSDDSTVYGKCILVEEVDCCSLHTLSAVYPYSDGDDRRLVFFKFTGCGAMKTHDRVYRPKPVHIVLSCGHDPRQLDRWKYFARDFSQMEYIQSSV